jgi:hypothetical protein
LAETDPPLDGAALGILATALAGAFGADDLAEAVLVDLDQDLYAVYVARDTAIAPLTLALVQGLEQRGWVVRFFRAARKRRPDNGPLITTIRQYCPAAMQDEPPAAAEVTVLVDALKLIRDRLSDPQVASAVVGSRGELKSLAAGLARLRVYKNLHDVLQKIQVSQFSLLVEYIRRLRTDPQVSVSLRDLLLEFRMTFTKASKGLRPLEASQDDVEEKGWIDSILAAVKEIDQARDGLDDRAARLATRKIRDLLQSQPNRINFLLRTEARKLPLQTLSDAVTTAAAAPGLTATQRGVLESGVASVTELRLRLARRVADHDRWQLVERQLWLMDAVVEREGSDITEFEEYWQLAKENILKLWSADPKAEWVVTTQGQNAAIDTALTAVPPEAQRARSVYGEFRSTALWQFYSVDGELIELCEDVLVIAEPVMALVEGTR